MKKYLKLIGLKKDCGIYVATIYNMGRGTAFQWKFWFYSKKGVIKNLRENFNCIVPHSFY